MTRKGLKFEFTVFAKITELFQIDDYGRNSLETLQVADKIYALSSSIDTKNSVSLIEIKINSFATQSVTETLIHEYTVSSFNHSWRESDLEEFNIKDIKLINYIPINVKSPIKMFKFNLLMS